MRPLLLAACLSCFASTAHAQVTLPVPTIPTPRVVTERGVSPVYHRITPHIVLPLVRGGLGATLRLPAGGFDTQVAFTFDLLAGVAVRLGRGANLGLVGEVGYSYEGFDMHLGLAGLGVLWGIAPPRDVERPMEGLHIAVIPHVVAGTAYDTFALGVRPCVAVGYLTWAVELAWQTLFLGDRPTHEARLMFTTLAPFLEGM